MPSCTRSSAEPVRDPDANEALWRDADAVLEQLLDLAPEARAAALEAMTPSPALRAAVVRLLAAHESDGGSTGRHTCPTLPRPIHWSGAASAAGRSAR